jgi:four helix bundle protein
MTKFRFEDLEVWQKAILLAKNIYQITDVFPKSKKYNLVSQLK